MKVVIGSCCYWLSFSASTCICIGYDRVVPKILKAVAVPWVDDILMGGSNYIAHPPAGARRRFWASEFFKSPQSFCCCKILQVWVGPRFSRFG